MPEIGSSGLMSGGGGRGVAECPKLPRPSSTLPQRTWRRHGLNAGQQRRYWRTAAFLSKYGRSDLLLGGQVRGHNENDICRGSSSCDIDAVTLPAPSFAQTTKEGR